MCLAMDMLTACGIGPPGWATREQCVSMWQTNVGAIAMRLSPQQTDLCADTLEAVVDNYAPLEEHMHTLLEMAQREQTLRDNFTYMYGGRDGINAPVGHAFQVLAVLLMQGGAFFPDGFKQIIHRINAKDCFARHPKDPLRPFVMAEFDKLVAEYDAVVRPGLDQPEEMTVTRIHYGQNPNPMFYTGPPNERDAVWAAAIKQKHAEGQQVRRKKLTRPVPPASTRFSIGAPRT
jgi:hypothetical protein